MWENGPHRSFSQGKGLSNCKRLERKPGVTARQAGAIWELQEHGVALLGVWFCFQGSLLPSCRSVPEGSQTAGAGSGNACSICRQVLKSIKQGYTSFFCTETLSESEVTKTTLHDSGT